MKCVYNEGMRKVGRPRALMPDEVDNIVRLLSIYINNSDIPIIAEFAYMNDIPRQTLYDYDEFSTLRKKCIDKKESQLEKLGLLGDVNSTMAIFSLKQIGWSDKPKEEIVQENKFAEQIKKALGSLHEDA